MGKGLGPRTATQTPGPPNKGETPEAATKQWYQRHPQKQRDQLAKAAAASVAVTAAVAAAAAAAVAVAAAVEQQQQKQQQVL